MPPSGRARGSAAARALSPPASCSRLRRCARRGWPALLATWRCPVRWRTRHRRGGEPPVCRDLSRAPNKKSRTEVGHAPRHRAPLPNTSSRSPPSSAASGHVFALPAIERRSWTRLRAPRRRAPLLDTSSRSDALYSRPSAVTGSIRAARRAGKKPKTRPIVVLTPSAITSDAGSSFIGQSSAAPNPRIIR